MTISRTQALTRSYSTPRPSPRPLDPEVQRLDTVVDVFLEQTLAGLLRHYSRDAA